MRRGSKGRPGSSVKRAASGSRGISYARRFSLIGLSIVIVFAVAYVTYLMATVTVETIEVEGAYHAPTAAVVDFTGVQTGDTLFALEPELVEHRVARHQWIKSARVTRWIDGTLAVSVDERKPVALVLTEDGLPEYYLDREGITLPVDTLARYDVPLLRGVSGELGPMANIEDPHVLELLNILSGLDPSADNLISDIEMVEGAGFDLVTVPLGRRRSIRVRLGMGDYGLKFAKLAAFWEQSLLEHPEKNIEWIDLRFSGQVVTKET